MIPPRYLTKSRFKLGLECPTKLYYTKKEQYVDKKLDDDFLAALAKGGFQVGELAKCYFPGGVNIDELDYEIALAKTNELLRKDSVIIYEAAFRYGNLFIRADVIVKKGNAISLYEVKAKSADSVDEQLTTKAGLPNATWKPYLCDIAFQRYVVQNSLPGHNISAFLMVADKSSLASIDGLNQRFFLTQDPLGRAKINIIGDVSPIALGRKILCAIYVGDIIDRIFAEEVFDTYLNLSFEGLITLFADKYEKDELIQGDLKAYCRDCEFRASSEDESNGFLSGFKECWTRVYGLTPEDFQKPSVLDIWNCRSKDSFIKERRLFQAEIQPQDLQPKTTRNSKVVEAGLSNMDRQIMQITKSKDNDNTIYCDVEGLSEIFRTFKYPLHFIDFETTAVAIPFNMERRPYEQIAFQFSHHIIYEDGTIEHKGQWIDTEQGRFPNFQFVRELKNELGEDDGTIFRYSAHENSILNAIFRQLCESQEPDRRELCDWIKTITKSSQSTAESWIGDRNMIDLCELVKKYYYAPETNGSNSIKAVLPAVINNSSFLKGKYSQPIYGTQVKSLNFNDHIWIKFNDDGTIINPYYLLNPVFEGVDSELLDGYLTSEEGEIRDGGAAMVAYAQMQFTQMEIAEREFIRNALLKYCELDTLAMVMIWEEWNKKINI
ncbi:DUF2779 domain-containing protein [Mucilaginibacter agri]|uniref:DUF2779 domain-containing protein n=1 Tax=Mucilaginibacter agri TaxID=2695265 RepID=A0A965ZBY9_9SPHI|nr:DUF2779 domain-containing protein [Mucilaginibacter agri]NCD67895.1 DUF2779 domain-containing protein [Mucilaginibacter agri]